MGMQQSAMPFYATHIQPISVASGLGTILQAHVIDMGYILGLNPRVPTCAYLVYMTQIVPGSHVMIGRAHHNRLAKATHQKHFNLLIGMAE